MKFNTKMLATLILGGLVFSGMASADSEQRSIMVKFQDLNLSSDAGLASLYRRIHTAAQSVCEQFPTSRQLGPQAIERKCIETAEDGAIRHINRDAVSAYYEAKTGRTVGLLAANIER